MGLQLTTSNERQITEVKTIHRRHYECDMCGIKEVLNASDKDDCKKAELWGYFYFRKTGESRSDFYLCPDCSEGIAKLIKNTSVEIKAIAQKPGKTP